MSDPPKPDHTPTLASGDGILCLGPLRSGSSSLVAALKILGFDNIHHGITHAFAEPDLVKLNRVAWPLLPYLRETLYPSGPPSWMTVNKSLQPPSSKPFTRKDWDELLGARYRGISDIGSLYAESLLQAYPDARVILVRRDFDAWARSLDAGFLTPLSSGVHGFARAVLAPLAGGSPLLQVQWDCLRAWIGGRTADECRAKLRERYDSHYDMVRRKAAPGKLLEMRLGDGWEPLCEFLGVEVPDVPFPRLNDAESLMKLQTRTVKFLLVMLAGRVATVAVLGGIVAVVLGRYTTVLEKVWSFLR